ncbi:type II secretion system F family protein [Blastococcus sp. TML/M2B]|uniref:type II secretion system F family protein n=1 Tax=unclassified Blastococcus TaxID=2619396 RepID=UPI00190C645F|nr:MULTISPECIES: type II secretion system F family protein [unclassified Blastococcus]MBN1092748.1 type II secretion system F family protein [Blastococcus sp. TML/M2B]MBN1097141.1 type II secretion system F family protein [Blastococcus sp. TML/C7B]MCA0145462.1 type II secretion system F family protein [Blastococcus sp. LR1]
MTGVVLLAGVCGALVVGGPLLAAHALTADKRPARPPRRRRPAAWADGPTTRRQRALWAAGAAAAAVVWLASGWPVGGVLAGLAVVGVPWLLTQFSAGNAAVERLEALQEWVRRTSDVLAAGGGLEQTLIRSARTAPEPIQVEVATLAARLQARWSTSRALLAFADDLDDAAGDLVVAALLLGAELRGPGLARVLTELAHSLTEEVTMRRKVEADRAKPRANARWLLLITVAAAGLAALNGDYLAPYGTALGQLVLAVIAALMVGCLLWMRRLTAAAPTVRFLVDPTTRGGAARDPEEVPAR